MESNSILSKSILSKSILSKSILSGIEENVAKVMIGKKEVTRRLLASLAAGGHVLLEDVPGTGKIGRAHV